MEKAQTLRKLEEALAGLQDKMMYNALRLTSNREEAMDLRQETSLRVLVNLDKYFHNTNFEGWVWRIMYNIFVNSYKRKALNLVVTDTTDTLYLLNRSQNSGLAKQESVSILSDITKAFNSIAYEFKRPFAMHFYGYKYKEIAAAMEIPLGTVKSRVFFARKQLKELLVDYK